MGFCIYNFSLVGLENEKVNSEHYFLFTYKNKSGSNLTGFSRAVGVSRLAIAEDPVYFPDANLKAAVESALGISDPTPTDMLSLTSLHANDSGIVDLTGIEYATNLTYLSLGFNQISDISALSGLTNLTYLSLDDNQISDISALSGLTNLTDLSLVYRQSDQRHLSAIGADESDDLDLYSNQISDISALSGLTNLTISGFWPTIRSATSQRCLSGLTNLTGLDLN